MANRHKLALEIQDACNPSGVAHAFVDACREFMESEEYVGTTSVKQDSALRLIAFKLANLMGSYEVFDLREFSTLVSECMENR